MKTNCPNCGHPIDPAALMGARGGAAGKGTAKRKALTSKAGKSAWAAMTPAERSAEMKRRAKVRAKNQKAK